MAPQRIPTIILAGLALVLGGAACGGKGGGLESPEAVAKALAAAGEANDPKAVEALFPTKEQLDEAMLCKEGKGPWEQIEKHAKAMVADLDEIRAELGEVIRVETREPEIVKPGDGKNGCRALVELTGHRGKVFFKNKKKGGEEDSEGLQFIKLGDQGWFLR
ncbi:MAG: hypothetical protein KC635_25860 [Myxococcales bacterium]|nr:hypothetical protein [Myxococcales bacterium]MCB9732625.1 hypothetical protein [Deltaproteobacteria bacterium]